MTFLHGNRCVRNLYNLPMKYSNIKMFDLFYISDYETTTLILNKLQAIIITVLLS